MKKTTWFYILTLGIGYLVAKNKAKKQVENVNTELKVSHEIDFPIDQLIKYLGDYNNIVGVDATMNNLKVNLNSLSLVNLEEIKKLGAKGTFSSNKQLTILFGDNSQAIANELKQACHLE